MHWAAVPTGTAPPNAAGSDRDTRICTPPSTTTPDWAYTEELPDEKGCTAAAFWERAKAFFAAHGIEDIQRVLTDNGSCYRSALFNQALGETTHKYTRPYRPRLTNGKIERFHRTLAQGWAFRRFYNSETAQRKALPPWLHEYNHHRPHTAIGKVPPISRLTNVPGQYI